MTIFCCVFLFQQAIERQKAAREGAIVMYRKYRSGDLPDIQIKFSELIAPLQALAQVRTDTDLKVNFHTGS